MNSECKGCNYPKNYDCDCEELKKELESILDEVAEVAERLKLNVQISAQDGKVTCITWYRDLKGNIVSNDYFNLEV